MNGALRLFNRQRTRSINARLLHKIICHFLRELLRLEDYDLTVTLVNAARMTRLNETIMQHAGSTDVITLDYSIPGPEPMPAGELFVCVDEAVIQARRFDTTWPSELVRYIVHGVLHLRGFDDLKRAARRRMKREENRRLREISREFRLSKLERKTTVGR